jgi:hypothetical protein
LPTACLRTEQENARRPLLRHRLDDAAKRAKCKTNAVAICTIELGKIAASKEGFAAAVPAKCVAVSFADAAGDGGLGYGDGVVAATRWPDSPLEYRR